MVKILFLLVPNVSFLVKRSRNVVKLIAVIQKKLFYTISETETEKPI